MWNRVWMVVAAIAVAAGWPDATRAGVRWGVVGGALAARFEDGNGDRGGLERDPRWAMGATAGLVAERTLGRGFGLVAGLEYSGAPDVARVTNHDLQIFVGGSTYEMRALWTIRQHAVVLPVRVEYRRGPFRAGVGPQVRYLVSASRKSSESELVEIGGLIGTPQAPRPAPSAQIFEDVGTFDGSGDATAFYERWTLSALASLGVAWPTGRHELRADLRTATDLTRATKELGGGEHSTAIQLGLGVLW